MTLRHPLEERIKSDLERFERTVSCASGKRSDETWRVAEMRGDGEREVKENKHE